MRQSFQPWNSIGYSWIGIDSEDRAFIVAKQTSKELGKGFLHDLYKLLLSLYLHSKLNNTVSEGTHFT